MANPFTYSELHSKDAKKARVHGWDVRPAKTRTLCWPDTKR
jgi:hypothetical protein